MSFVNYTLIPPEGAAKICDVTLFVFRNNFTSNKPSTVAPIGLLGLVEPYRPNQNCSKFTQVSIAIGTLCFCKKKFKMFHSIPFFYEK